MTTDTATDGLRARISRQGEEPSAARLGLLESPFVSSALSRAFEAREKAAQAQEVAMGALNLPSAGDLERLTRRVRSVSQRLEGVEDALDRPAAKRRRRRRFARAAAQRDRGPAVRARGAARSRRWPDRDACRRARRTESRQTDAHARGRRKQARRRETT